MQNRHSLLDLCSGFLETKNAVAEDFTHEHAFSMDYLQQAVEAYSTQSGRGNDDEGENRGVELEDEDEVKANKRLFEFGKAVAEYLKEKGAEEEELLQITKS